MEPPAVNVAHPVPGGAVESQVARDIARHALIVAPLVVGALAFTLGRDAAVGAALAFAIVAGNFLLNAALITWAARISPATVAVAVLGGYVLRLALVTAAGLAVRTQSWVDFTAFCIVLIAAHLGLLVWELRSVSLSLAAPGLRPNKE